MIEFKTLQTLTILILLLTAEPLQFVFISECVREKLRLFLEEPQNNIFRKCFAPFMSNVTYGLIDGYESLPSCNEYDATTQSLTIANFFFAAALYGLEECKGTICPSLRIKISTTHLTSV